MNKKIKKPIIISLLCAIIGSFEMYWFLPNGLSCIDAKSGVIEAILKFMSIQLLIVFLIQIILKFNISLYTTVIYLSIYWFLINKNEFTYRYACWSTFSNSDILYYSFNKSIIPMSTCLSIVIMGAYFYYSKNKTTE